MDGNYSSCHTTWKIVWNIVWVLTRDGSIIFCRFSPKSIFNWDLRALPTKKSWGENIQLHLHFEKYFCIIFFLFFVLLPYWSQVFDLPMRLCHAKHCDLVTTAIDWTFSLFVTVKAISKMRLIIIIMVQNVSETNVEISDTKTCNTCER